MKKNILFITGTRADFGKLKPLLCSLEKSKNFNLHVFVTGMHLMQKYDYTYHEIENTGFSNIYKFINQNNDDSMAQILSKTISGFNDYVKENTPDLVVVHGDRVETLGIASAACLNNILVAHIEGGEVSGTVDEMMRHATSKLSNIHFVSNDKAKDRLIQMGEEKSNIYVIGSPETDIIHSKNLPSINEVKKYYEIQFDKYAICIFHPVTTELNNIKSNINSLVSSLIDNKKFNFIIIHPNNDSGSSIILDEYKKLNDNPRFKFFKSMRFEYFITLMKNASFFMGNSSSGVREAPLAAIPSINIGSRQMGRANVDSIINCDYSKSSITRAINNIETFKTRNISEFGDGGVSDKFMKIISQKDFWLSNTQKYFIDK